MNSTSQFKSGDLVALYARDSGGDTQELSVLQQENAFREWCTHNRLIPGIIFKDLARPGSSVVGRSGFHDMIHHFRSGQAQEAGLVIWSYSRFARDFEDSQFYRADLRRNGYIFHSLNDDIPEGSIGKLFEAVIDWKNQTFLEDLSRDTRRGLHDLVRNYGAVPGTPPRGFKTELVTIGKRRDGRDRIAHRWIPDPDMTPKVQQAFAMRAAGKTIIEIQSTTRIYISINCYKTFFTNKLYIGILEFGDQVIEGYCEPIIDQNTWNIVQAKIQEYAQRKNLKGPNHPRRVNSSYLLSGLVYCARCGSPLFGASSTQRKRSDGSPSIYKRYACTRAYRRRDCDQDQFPQKVLDGAVLESLSKYMLLPEVLAQLQETIRASQDEPLTRIDEQRRELGNSLAGLRRRISRLTEAIADAGHTRALLEKLAGLESEEIIITTRLAELDLQAVAAASDHTDDHDDQLISMADHLPEILLGEDLQTLQAILRGFIDRISVDRDENRILGTVSYFLQDPILGKGI